ncbi:MULTISPECIES: DUF6049 family protein [unclassified Corynebacterium]|uniref:DUF6049 family protein n=1 Tax=unclassified Corynebacterium TaxID=2624378 RepID=UPI00216A405F|nr:MULTISPECIES: DUF6049 family protein [unclassified Corynebacterium]MCS4490467.1 DUF6049 family protein [Corynebacterium sp. ES2775-CONJ]MCS4532269.1 DUF6049 family protein [Corynebacterium sp. ES2730-CONJ]
MKPSSPHSCRLALGIALTLSMLAPTSALANPLPHSPNNPAALGTWVGQSPRVDKREPDLAISLDRAPAQISFGQVLQVSLSVRNNTDSEMDNIIIVPKRAAEPRSVNQALELPALSQEAYPFFANTIDIDGPIVPGETRHIDIEIPTAAQAIGGFDIIRPGIYPLLFGVQNTTSGQRYSSQRFLLNVAADPSTPRTPQDAKEEETDNPERAPGLTLIYPITAVVDILGGETGEAGKERAPLIMRSENLARQLAPDGRLSTIVKDFRTVTDREPALKEASCIALDPQLIDTVSRMTQGYRIATERPSSVSQNLRLRDSWFFADQDIDSIPGSASDDAARWLAELKALLSTTSCVVALPWANTDINGLAKLGDSWLMREALDQGALILRRELGVNPAPDIVIPASGYLEPTTISSLGWADYSTPTNNNQMPTDLATAWNAREPKDTDTTTAPLPQRPITVLLADNSFPQTSGRFAPLAPGIRAAGFDSLVASSFAHSAPDPLTMSYTPDSHRYDFRQDSLVARSNTASNILRLSISQRTEEDSQPLVVPLPSNIDSGQPWLDTAAELLRDRAAQPRNLLNVITPLPQEQEALDQAEEFVAVSSPFPDPAQIADTELLAAKGLVSSIDNLTRLMISDSAISLSPYEFTEPLRRDVIRSFTLEGRQSIARFDEHSEDIRNLIAATRETLAQLRNSVSLIPPGNVFTRTSDSSPLLVVAQNGLPLPVDARLAYSGPNEAKIGIPREILIPAKGSITISMNANLEAVESRRADLRMWLTTNTNDAISESVTMGVQTRSGLSGTSGFAGYVLLALVIVLIGRIFPSLLAEFRRDK